MQISKQHIILTIFLLSSIYLFRNNHTSPGTFLRQHTSRLLQQSIAEKVCDGIDPNEGFTQSEIDRSEGFRTSLNTLRGGNPLEDFIDEGNRKSDLLDGYFRPLIPFAAAWIVCLGVGFVGFVGCTVNWCCMYLCKNKCKGCKMCKEPKKQKCKNLFLIGGLFFSVATVGGSLAGIVLSGGVSAGAKKTSCSLANMLQELKDGNSEREWIGIEPSVDRFDELINKFDGIVKDLEPVSTEFDDMSTTSDETAVKIQELFDEGTQKTITRADPAEGAQYQPTYIVNIGPPENPVTETGKLLAEVEIKNATVQEAATDLNSSIAALKNDQSEYKLNLVIGRDLCVAISDQIDDMLEGVESFSNTVSSASDGIGVGLMSIFVVNLVVALLSLGSMLLVCLCRLKFFNKFVHFGWCLMGIFMIFGWFLSLILFPGSLVLMESCDVIDTLLEDPSFFNKTFDMLGGSDADAEETLYSCIHGDANILNRLGVSESLGHFETIIEALNQTSDYYAENIFTVESSVEFPIQQDSLRNTMSGVYIDSTETETDLAELELHTWAEETCYRSVFDLWMLNNLNCSESLNSYETGDDDNENLGTETCIGFNVWISNGGDIFNRYTSSQYPDECELDNGLGQTYREYVINFIQNFEQNRNDITTLFGRLRNKMDLAEEANELFMEALRNVTEPFYSINDTISPVYPVLTDNTTGLIANNNCSLVLENFLSFSEAMCVGFIASMYQTAICMIVVSFFTFFGSFFGFCLAKRFVVSEDNQKNDENDKSMEEKNLITGKKKKRIKKPVPRR